MFIIGTFFFYYPFELRYLYPPQRTFVTAMERTNDRQNDNSCCSNEAVLSSLEWRQSKDKIQIVKYSDINSKIDSGSVLWEYVIDNESTKTEILPDKGIKFISILGGYIFHKYIAIVLVTKVSHIINIRGNNIYKPTKFKIIEIPNKNLADKKLTNAQLAFDFYLLKCLRLYLDTETFYFSPELDLSEQLLPQLNNDISENNVRNKFMNNYVGRQVLSQINGLDKFSHPFISGYVGFSNVPGEPSILLISRKTSAGEGRRLWRRGAGWEDPSGSCKGGCGNCYECEFILYDEKKAASFIVIRGSAPIVFDQHPNAKFTPPVVIANEEVCDKAFEEHIDMLRQSYGSVCCINLMRKQPEGSDLEHFVVSRRNEFTLSQTYEKLCNNYDKTHKDSYKGKPSLLSTTLPKGEEDVPADKIGPLTYIHFDFHTRCKRSFVNKSKKDKNSSDQTMLPKAVASSSTVDAAMVIAENIEPVEYADLACLESALKVILKKYGLTKYGENQTHQSGVIRINCLDSLDRTNIVQAIATKCALQTLDFGIEKAKDVWKRAYEVIRAQGNEISKTYSGTGTLHSGLISKKGTNSGMFQMIGDGLKSLKRYMINNYMDGHRQDSSNVGTGYFRVISRCNKDSDKKCQEHAQYYDCCYKIGDSTTSIIPKSQRPPIGVYGCLVASVFSCCIMKDVPSKKLKIATVAAAMLISLTSIARLVTSVQKPRLDKSSIEINSSKKKDMNDEENNKIINKKVTK